LFYFSSLHSQKKIKRENKGTGFKKYVTSYFVSISVPLNPYFCFFIAMNVMNVHIMSKAAAITTLIHIHFFFFIPALTVKRFFFFFMIYGFPALIMQIAFFVFIKIIVMVA